MELRYNLVRSKNNVTALVNTASRFGKVYFLLFIAFFYFKLCLILYNHHKKELSLCKRVKKFPVLRQFQNWRLNVIILCFLFRTVEMETQAADCINAGIRMTKEMGFLHLGKIDQEYIQDPDLREILEKTVLDSNKTGVFEDQQLRLITSVIYSQCFAVKGNRKKEVF